MNIAIDPYGILGIPAISRLNKVKPIKSQNVRLFKAVDVSRVKPEMVFLGSSRTDYGMNPSHPALQNYQPVYNLAILGANMYEVRRYFEHAIANQSNLKKAIINIDFFMFNDLKKETPDFKESRLEKTGLTVSDAFNSIFSIDGLIASARTVKTNIENPTAVGPYYPNGQRDAEDTIENIYGNQPTRDIFRKTLKSNGFIDRANRGEKVYEISQSYLKELQIIVDLCKKKGIDCQIFISPSHATHRESILVSGVWQLFEEWQREIVKITPVWSFSGYNSITTEPISDSMKNYIDPSHYRSEVGDLVINRLFGANEDRVPDDFGVLLTPENIEDRIKQVRSDREIWAKKHPDEVKLVEDLRQ
ncbi:MAG: hypothetical protein SXA11_03035 [Cyanobacteriota bacterium]|nr:hypothetical protein [Cyanobacteriota bacterium]